MKVEIQSLHKRFIYWVINEDRYFKTDQVFFSPFLLSYFFSFNILKNIYIKMNGGWQQARTLERRKRKERK